MRVVGLTIILSLFKKNSKLTMSLYKHIIPTYIFYSLDVHTPILRVFEEEALHLHVILLTSVRFFLFKTRLTFY